MMEVRKKAKGREKKFASFYSKLFTNANEKKATYENTRFPEQKKAKLRAQWTHEALKKAVQAIDEGYTMEEVSIHYGISRISLRDHVSAKTKSRKMGLVPTLIKKEELVL